MLSDKDTYDLIAKDPTKKSQIRSLLAGWKSKGYRTNTTYNSIYCSDGNLPRAYGLPKIHKPGFYFRLIVSSIDGSDYQLAYFIHKIISKDISKPSSHNENSFQLVKKLNGLPINDDYDLISLDVVSLFTNILINLALNVTRWEQIRKGTKIPLPEFINALRKVLDSTFDFLALIIRYTSKNSVLLWAHRFHQLLLILLWRK